MSNCLFARALGSLTLFALIPGFVAPAPAADGHNLTPQLEAGAVADVEVTLEAGGDLKFMREGEAQFAELSVAGRMSYEERLVASSGDSPRRRSLRRYEKAAAVIKIDDHKFQPSLRDGRRLIGVDSRDGRTTLYSPAGPLSREELDLIDVAADSLLIDQLLPSREVELEQSWSPDKALLAQLLGLDAVATSDVLCTLREITSEAARIELAGHVTGAVDGVASEITLKARLQFDLGHRRVTWCSFAFDEKRSVGHVGPGIDATSRVTLRIKPRSQPRRLTDAAIEGLTAAPDEQDLLLSYESPARRVELLLDRRWHVVSEDTRLTVLRYVDRGELIAQCNVSPLAPLGEDRMVTLENFKNDLRRLLDDSFGRFLSAEEGTDDQGRTHYRVVVEGKTNDLEIRWHYHRIAEDDGHQAVLIFTLEPSLVERFGDADERVVKHLGFPRPTPQQAAKPDKAAAK